MVVIAAQEAAASDTIQKPQSQPAPEKERPSTLVPETICGPPPPPTDTDLRSARRRGHNIPTGSSTYDDEDESFDERIFTKYRTSYELFQTSMRSDGRSGYSYAEAMEVNVDAADALVTGTVSAGANSAVVNDAGSYRESSVEDSDSDDDGSDDSDDEMSDGEDGSTAENKDDDNGNDNPEFEVDSDGDITMTDAQRIALGLFAASSTPTTGLRGAKTRSAARAAPKATFAATPKSTKTPRKNAKKAPKTPVNNAASESGLFKNAKNTGNTTEHRSLGWYDSTSFSPLESSGELAEIAAAKANKAKDRGRKKKHVEEESEEETPDRILPSSSDDGRQRRTRKDRSYKEDSDHDDDESADEEQADISPKKRGRKPKNVASDTAPKTRKPAKKRQQKDAVFKPDASSEVDEEPEEEETKAKRGRKKAEVQTVDEEQSDESEEQGTENEDTADEEEQESQEGPDVEGSGSDDEGHAPEGTDSNASEDEDDEQSPPPPEPVAVRGKAEKKKNVSRRRSQSTSRSQAKRVDTEHQSASSGEPSALRKAQAEKAFELQEEYKRDGLLREAKMTGFIPSVASWFGGRKEAPPPAPRPPTPEAAPPPPTQQRDGEDGRAEDEPEDDSDMPNDNGQQEQSDDESSDNGPHGGNDEESDEESEDGEENDNSEDGESGEKFEITAKEIREIEEEMEDAVDKLMHQMDQNEGLRRQLSEKTVKVDQLESKLAEESQKATEASLELEAKKKLAYDGLSYLYRFKPHLSMNDIPCLCDKNGLTQLDVQTFEHPPFSTKLVNNPFRHEDMYHRREIVNNLTFPGNVMLVDFETDYHFRCCNCHATSEVRLLFFQDELIWSTCICFTCFEHFCCAKCTRYTAPKDPARLPSTTDMVDRMKQGEASGNYETRLYVRGIWADYLEQKEKRGLLDHMEDEIAPIREENDAKYDKAAEKTKELGLRAAGKGKRKRGVAEKEEEGDVNPKSKKQMIAARREQLAAARRQERRPPPA
ncbi:hypothetical protein TWF696_004422 [Orbilia brochopaga]|uniref:Uncharacterized protein n=1 Tax=Orbilia brochopaga TaxID=3140254 RepID=A0AAV9V628_9PEZI